MKHANPLVLLVFGAFPYALLSWGYSEIVNGDHSDFWLVLGVMVGMRLFFYAVETVGSIAAWRLYQRQIAVENALTLFRTNGYPQRAVAFDDLLNYLSRIQSGEEYQPSLRTSALDLERTLSLFESFGILVGARVRQAYEIALDLYAPRSSATRQDLESK